MKDGKKNITLKSLPVRKINDSARIKPLPGFKRHSVHLRAKGSNQAVTNVLLGSALEELEAAELKSNRSKKFKAQINPKKGFHFDTKKPAPVLSKRKKNPNFLVPMTSSKRKLSSKFPKHLSNEFCEKLNDLWNSYVLNYMKVLLSTKAQFFDGNMQEEKPVNTLLKEVSRNPKQREIFVSKLQKFLLKCDYHGAKVKIARSTNKSLQNLQGIVVRESKNMFYIAVEQYVVLVHFFRGDKSMVKNIPKRDNLFEITLSDISIVLRGTVLISIPAFRSRARFTNKLHYYTEKTFPKY